MKTRLKKASWTLAVTLGGLAGVTAVMVIISVVFGRFGGCIRLYREIGATPWHRPETVITADHSEHFTDEEINAAIQTVMGLYENEWYSYNEVYLLELTYDDGFSESLREDNKDGNDRIYLRSVIKTGYSYDMEGTWGKGRVYEYGYWTLDRLSDGSWECRGWGMA